MIFEVEISDKADIDLRNIYDKEKSVVTIIRVMYGGRDIDTQLKKYTN